MSDAKTPTATPEPASDRTPDDDVVAKRKEFLALPDNMSLAKQMEELKKHANTPMTYAEMRAKFG